MKKSQKKDELNVGIPAVEPALSPPSPLLQRGMRRSLPWFPRALFPTATSRKVHIVLFITFPGWKSAEAMSLSSGRKHFLWLRGKPSCAPNSRHRSRPVYCRPRIHQPGPREKGEEPASLRVQTISQSRRSTQFNGVEEVRVWGFSVSTDN